MVLFLDDLDQLAEVEDVPTVFRRLLDVKPCISIVHFRTESLMEHVKREVPEQIALDALTAETLVEVVMRRLHGASEQVRQTFPRMSNDPLWAPLRWLAGRAGNPLTLLRWFHGLLRAHGFIRAHAERVEQTGPREAGLMPGATGGSSLLRAVEASVLGRLLDGLDADEAVALARIAAPVDDPDRVVDPRAYQRQRERLLVRDDKLQRWARLMGVGERA